MKRDTWQDSVRLKCERLDGVRRESLKGYLEELQDACSGKLYKKVLECRYLKTMIIIKPKIEFTSQDILNKKCHPLKMIAPLPLP